MSTSATGASMLAAAAAFAALASAGCAGAEKLAPIDLDSQTSPVPDDFGREAQLEQRYQDVLLPEWESPGLSGWFSGVAGVGISYWVFRSAAEKGAVVLVNGRAEASLKYVEVIHDLVGQGYSVYALDHRGQGASGRMIESNPQIGYVEFFNDYVADLHTFVEQVVRSDPHPHLFALSHSLGGAILPLYLHKHPDVFEAVVLASPMIAPNTGAFPEFAATDIALAGCGWGEGRSYVPGHGDFNAAAEFDDPGQNVSHSRARWELKMRQLIDHPELRLGGASYRWLCEALTTAARLRALGQESQTRTLLLQAGDEQVVLTKDQDNYCDAAAACQKIGFEGAFHELLMESDATRNRALTMVVRYFDHFALDGGTP
ncbi:MAG: alpha/beta fold hydrolase [Deltaproteobacteria bacterium]|nr:alpha/beta fold hydrolase [Deltaproteobacteria bacterium]